MPDEEKITANTDENPSTVEAAALPEDSKDKESAKPKTRRKKRTDASVTELEDKNQLKAEEKNENNNESEDLDTILDAPSLDSLIIDDAPISSVDKQEESGGFDAFLADYRNAIKKTLSAARSAFNKSSSDEAEPLQGGEEPELSDNKEPDAQDEENTQFAMDIGGEFIPEEEPVFEDPEESKNTYDPEKPRVIDNVFDFVELFVFTLAAVLILTTFLFKHTIVDGPSMMNTLQHRDHLIISDLFYTPERGDIIVFQDPVITGNEPYVKRVIAIAGDTVTVDGNGQVTVNGEKIDESDYVFIDGNVPYNGKTVVVPEGEVFVLGDHRNNSRDSASFPEGTIKIESILGKVLLRIYPFDKIGTVD